MRNKVILVIGGSKGIGKEVSKMLFELGGNVIISGRDEKALQDTKEYISPQKIETFKCDACESESVGIMLKQIHDRYGKIDIVIDFAGWCEPKHFKEMEQEDLERGFRLNYLSQASVALACVKYNEKFGISKKHKKMNLVLVGSVASFVGLSGYTVYSPMKHAVLGLMRSLSHELSDKMKISIVLPPDTDTDSFKKENTTKPKETAIISKVCGVMTSRSCAQLISSGLICRRYYIFPLGTISLWRLLGFLPELYNVIDFQGRITRMLSKD